MRRTAEADAKMMDAIQSECSVGSFVPSGCGKSDTMGLSGGIFFTFAHAHIENLPFPRRVIDERMRLYSPPPGPSARQAMADPVICGHKGLKRTQVLIAPWIIHSHSKLGQAPHFPSHPHHLGSARRHPEDAGTTQRRYSAFRSYRRSEFSGLRSVSWTR